MDFTDYDMTSASAMQRGTSSHPRSRQSSRQSWSFEPIDEEEGPVLRPVTNAPVAAFPAPSHRIHCPRCGTANARGVQLPMKGGVRENSKGKKDESKQEERKVRNVESPGKKNQLEIDAEWKKSEDQNKMEEQKEKAVRNPGKDNVLDWEVQENERKDAEDKVKAAVALIRMLLV